MRRNHMATRRRIAVLGVVGALVLAVLAVTGPAQAHGSSERTTKSRSRTSPMARR
jgi:hypothetical protein